MFLDYFALAVLLILAAAAVVIWVILGLMPGRIAKQLTRMLDTLSAAPVASPLVGSLPRPKQTAAPIGARQRSAGSQRGPRAPGFVLSLVG